MAFQSKTAHRQAHLLIAVPVAQCALHVVFHLSKASVAPGVASHTLIPNHLLNEAVAGLGGKTLHDVKEIACSTSWTALV